MATFSESSVKAFPATVAHVKGTAVKFSGVNVVVATAATDAIIGVIDTPNDAGYNANVRLRSASGTAIGLAGGNITVGARVTATTGGELIVTTTAGNEVVGIALEAAADGGEFEFMPSISTVKA